LDRLLLGSIGSSSLLIALTEIFRDRGTNLKFAGRNFSAGNLFARRRDFGTFLTLVPSKMPRAI
jgi:hypothetical protein